MKILVTGQKGFIGSRLYEILASKEYELTGFGGDITDTKTFDKGNFDVVIHLASLISHRENWTPEDYTRVNIEGTRNIVDFYPESKIIYISTKDVEREELNPYSESKLASESIVAVNPKNLIIRLPSVFGPKQRQKDKLIPRLIDHYISGTPITITTNDEREYIYIDEVCNQIISHLEDTGLIQINGLRVRNYRLKDLVEHTVKNKELELTQEEKLFCSWLSNCI